MNFAPQQGCVYLETSATKTAPAPTPNKFAEIMMETVITNVFLSGAKKTLNVWVRFNVNQIRLSGALMGGAFAESLAKAVVHQDRAAVFLPTCVRPYLSNAVI